MSFPKIFRGTEGFYGTHCVAVLVTFTCQGARLSSLSFFRVQAYEAQPYKARPNVSAEHAILDIRNQRGINRAV